MPKKNKVPKVKHRDYWANAVGRATKKARKDQYKSGTGADVAEHKGKVEAFQSSKSRKKDKKLGGLDKRLLRLANRNETKRRAIRTQKTKDKIIGGPKKIIRANKTASKAKGSYAKAIGHGKAASAEYKATGKVTAKGRRELYKMRMAGERFAAQVARGKRLNKRIKK